jgi:hypothetical protein
MHTGQDKVKGGILWDVVVAESASVFELLVWRNAFLMVGRNAIPPDKLAGENNELLIEWNAFLILNLGLYVLDGIRRLDIQGGGLAGPSLHKNLHSSAKTQMQSGILAFFFGLFGGNTHFC